MVGKAGNKRTGTAGTAWPSMSAVKRAAAADALPWHFWCVAVPRHAARGVFHRIVIQLSDGVSWGLVVHVLLEWQGGRVFREKPICSWGTCSAAHNCQ